MKEITVGQVFAGAGIVLAILSLLAVGPGELLPIAVICLGVAFFLR